ncbi:hypothetical protein CRG98_042998 [Punica granatum]|uniref:Uncharacterized protein n=1 Tax=Punica granatum TaxID=22663 RepID=A0A2I0HY40_PUNGR|nr:hypothetical protein CRG98_042998 [Punica granatum]
MCKGEQRRGSALGGVPEVLAEANCPAPSQACYLSFPRARAKRVLCHALHLVRNPDLSRKPIVHSSRRRCPLEFPITPVHGDWETCNGCQLHLIGETGYM